MNEEIQANNKLLEEYRQYDLQHTSLRPEDDWCVPQFFKKLNEHAQIPLSNGYRNSGMDLYVDQETVLPPQTEVRVPSGVALAWLKHMHEAQIRPRSSTLRRGIHVALGTIDNGYRGELLVSAWNLTNEPIVLEKGQRIAQLVITNYLPSKAVEVSVTEETERGALGFGSSGV